MVLEAEIAWFAGLLEGEGYFSMEVNHTNKKIQRYPSIVIAMSDRDVVERCANLLGTKVSELRKRRPHHKPTYRCVIRGSGAVEWMRLVRPFMGERRGQKIDEIVQEWEQRPTVHAQSRMKRAEPLGFMSSFAKGEI